MHIIGYRKETKKIYVGQILDNIYQILRDAKASRSAFFIFMEWRICSIRINTELLHPVADSRLITYIRVIYTVEQYKGD